MERLPRELNAIELVVILKPEEDGANSETRAQRHSEQPGRGAHALHRARGGYCRLRVPCDSAPPGPPAAQELSAPSDDQPRAQCMKPD